MPASFLSTRAFGNGRNTDPFSHRAVTLAGGQMGSVVTECMPGVLKDASGGRPAGVGELARSTREGEDAEGWPR